MIESRAIIKNIPSTRNIIEQLRATFHNDYAFKDIIFVPNQESYNLNDDFLRVRVYIKTNWSNKVVLVRKSTALQNPGKVGTITLKKEFDTEQEACEYIEKEFINNFIYGFEFSRTGWHYSLGQTNFFVEDIENFKPSIEIEADSEEDLKYFLDHIGVEEVITESLPEVMRKIINL